MNHQTNQTQLPNLPRPLRHHLRHHQMHRHELPSGDPRGARVGHNPDRSVKQIGKDLLQVPQYPLRACRRNRMA